MSRARVSQSQGSMQRRELLALLGGFVAAQSVHAQPGSPPVIGFLNGASADGYAPYARNGHPGQTYCTSFALAERICRATDWVYSPRMSRSRDHWRRSTPPSRTGNVRAILRRGAHASVARKRRSPNSPGPASWQSELVPRSRRASSPLRPNLGFRDTQAV
jgi:hypothetical protein